MRPNAKRSPHRRFLSSMSSSTGSVTSAAAAASTCGRPARPRHVLASVDITMLWIVVFIVSIGMLAARETSSSDSVRWMASRCCVMGEELAETFGKCSGSEELIKSHFPLSRFIPRSCRGFLNRCCRRRVAAVQCKLGQLHAEAKETCDALNSTKAEECCATCRDGLSSRTCSAPWLEDEPRLLDVFQHCCKRLHHHPARTASTTQQRLSRQSLLADASLDVTSRAETTATPAQPRRSLRLIRGDAKGERAKEGGPITCGSGYQYNTALAKCEDIDECFLGKYACPVGKLCVNKPGAYECTASAFELQKVEVIPDCPAGFFYSRHLQECVDRDECSSGDHGCLATEVCMNTLGSFVCRSKSSSNCEAGYVFRADHGCVDMDECSNKHDCSSAEICVDRQGQYMCVTPCATKGHQVDPVTLECIECSSPDTCNNTPDSLRLKLKVPCKKGHKRNSHGNCEDIDECMELQSPCGPDARCINTDGDFACHRECGVGYRHVNGTCIDKDECASKEFTCLAGQRCMNIPGSYDCVDEDCERVGKVTAPDGTCLLRRSCLKGYYHDAEIDACRDVNECASQNPACQTGEDCINTIGSFYCVPAAAIAAVVCPEGLQRSEDGLRCENIDECQQGLHSCHKLNEECVDVFGSFRCKCIQGLHRSHRGDCVRPGDAGCPPGHRYNGQICEDIDECSEPQINSTRLCDQICVNEVGSYRCHCYDGFEPHPSIKGKCEDVDECKQGMCKGICTNLPGTFRCTCPSGFTKSESNSCIDINECVSNAHNCSGSDSHCLNLPGGYRCIDFKCPDESRYRKDTKRMRCIRTELCDDHGCRVEPEMITFIHIPLRRNAAHHREKITVKPSRQPGTWGRFTLRVDQVIGHQLKPTTGRRLNALKRRLATDEDFRLESHKRWAKVFIRRPLAEPQDIHLTLQAKIYRFEGEPPREELQRTLQWKIVLYISGNAF